MHNYLVELLLFSSVKVIIYFSTLRMQVVKTVEISCKLIIVSLHRWQSKRICLTSDDSDETVRMHRRVWAFAGRLSDKYTYSMCVNNNLIRYTINTNMVDQRCPFKIWQKLW